MLRHNEVTRVDKNEDTGTFQSQIEVIIRITDFYNEIIASSINNHQYLHLNHGYTNYLIGRFTLDKDFVGRTNHTDNNDLTVDVSTSTYIFKGIVGQFKLFHILLVVTYKFDTTYFIEDGIMATKCVTTT